MAPKWLDLLGICLDCSGRGQNSMTIRRVIQGNKTEHLEDLEENLSEAETKPYLAWRHGEGKYKITRYFGKNNVKNKTYSIDHMNVKGYRDEWLQNNSSQPSRGHSMETIPGYSGSENEFFKKMFLEEIREIKADTKTILAWISDDEDYSGEEVEEEKKDSMGDFFSGMGADVMKDFFKNGMSGMNPGPAAATPPPAAGGAENSFSKFTKGI